MSSASDTNTFVVLLDTSEEVRYRTRQPDALSLLLELRNVTGRSADNRFSPSMDAPVRAVTIDERRESDGSFTTLVRLTLARPLPYRVATAAGSIRVEFARVPDAGDTAGTGGALATPTGTLEAFAAADVATEITDIDTRRVADGVIVTLRGNGRLLAGYVGPVAGSPPRLMLDFPDVTASVPSLLAAEPGPIDRIRVALNSRSPLVTRVVLDLAEEVDYEVLPSESAGRDLVLLVRDQVRVGPPAAAPAPTTGRAPGSTIAVGDPDRIDPMSALARRPDDLEASRERARWVDDPAAVLLRPEAEPESRPLPVTAPTTASPPSPAPTTASPTSPLPATAVPATPAPSLPSVSEPTPVAGPPEALAAAPLSPLIPADDPRFEPEEESLVARAEPPSALRTIDPGVALAGSSPAVPQAVPAASAPVTPPAVAPVVSEPLAATPVAAVSEPVQDQVPTAAPLILGDASVGQPARPGADPEPAPDPGPVPGPAPMQEIAQGPPPSPFGPPPTAPPGAAPGPPAATPGPPAPSAVAPPAAEQPEESQYTGHLVTLDFQSADLRAVLRTFAEISGLNMVIDPTVDGSVDVALRDVPWDQALDIILRANKLGYALDGTVVRIVPLTVMAEEEEERRRLADAQALAGELQVITQTLSYARATDLAQLLSRTILSPRGSAQVDERTNTLILNDLPDRLDTARGLIATLDRPEPQVEIEARIVQTTRDFARAIGVQWGVNGRMSQELGNTSGLVFPNTGSVSGRTGGLQGPPGDRPSTFEQTGTAVDLGVEAASSAIGLALGSVNGAFNLDMVLSALERSGNGRVLSTPRVSTQNNIEAEVTQGIQIPIQTVANNTVTVTFKDAALTLRVTPQITSANTVIMRITLENASPDFTRSVNGIPPIDTQRANTQVQVDDGATAVIGGIFISREQQVTDRTPLLHRIPLLGWLFKRDAVQDESRELLIFVTPRILR